MSVTIQVDVEAIYRITTTNVERRRRIRKTNELSSNALLTDTSYSIGWMKCRVKVMTTIAARRRKKLVLIGPT
jgi:hypothetical protein